MKSKLVLLTSIMLCLLLIAAAGCSGREDGNTAQPEQEQETDGTTGENAADPPAQTEPSIPNFNAEGYPIVNTPVKMKMAGVRHPFHGPWEEMDMFKYMEEITNIQYEFEAVPSAGWQERKNLMFASLDLPDVFFASTFTQNELMRYGAREKLLMPLNDLIDKYAPNLVKLMEESPEIRKSITSYDGNIYSFPGLNMFPVATITTAWVNYKWLDALGVQKLPETTEELYDLLVRFRDEDPDGNGQKDSYPLVSSLEEPLLAAFGHIPEENFEVKNDQVIFTPVQEGYKEYLKYSQRLYREGLIDQEAFTQTPQQIQAKGKENKVGLQTMSVPDNVFTAPTNEESVKYPILPALTSPVNSEKIYKRKSGINVGAAALSVNNPYPEAMVRWIDHFYSVDGSRLGLYGLEGVMWEFVDKEKGTVRYMTENIEPTGLAHGQFRGRLTPAVGVVPPLNNSQEIYLSFVGDTLVIHRNDEVIEKLDPHAVVGFPIVNYDATEFLALDRLSADINSFVSEHRVKFITGTDSIDDQWGAYVDQLKNLGYEELVDVKQAAYDRWKNAE